MVSIDDVSIVAFLEVSVCCKLKYFLYFYFSECTIKIKRNLKPFLLFPRNAQAIHEMPRGKFLAMRVLPKRCSECA